MHEHTKDKTIRYITRQCGLLAAALVAGVTICSASASAATWYVSKTPIRPPELGVARP